MSNPDNPYYQRSEKLSDKIPKSNRELRLTNQELRIWDFQKYRNFWDWDLRIVYSSRALFS